MYNTFNGEVEMKTAYLDTETTGLNPGQIAQLSMIVVDMSTNRMSGTYNYFFTVDNMEPGAENVHGFSKEKLDILSKGARFADRANEIYGILCD